MTFNPHLPEIINTGESTHAADKTLYMFIRETTSQRQQNERHCIHQNDELDPEDTVFLAFVLLTMNGMLFVHVIIGVGGGERPGQREKEAKCCEIPLLCYRDLQALILFGSIMMGGGGGGGGTRVCVGGGGSHLWLIQKVLKFCQVLIIINAFRMCWIPLLLYTCEDQSAIHETWTIHNLI